MNLAWFKTANSIHTHNIQMLADNPKDVLDFMDFLVVACIKKDVRYFIQGKSIRENGISWIMFEFFGEENQDKILSIILVAGMFSRLDNPFMMDEPTRELIKSLKLM